MKMSSRVDRCKIFIESVACERRDTLYTSMKERNKRIVAIRFAVNEELSVSVIRTAVAMQRTDTEEIKNSFSRIHIVGTKQVLYKSSVEGNWITWRRKNNPTKEERARSFGKQGETEWQTEAPRRAQSILDALIGPKWRHRTSGADERLRNRSNPGLHIHAANK